MIKKEHSVFIAYHGTYDKNGSVMYAEQIYKYLKGKGIDCFFFPGSHGEFYKANVKEIMQSSLFIMVCTNGIKRTENGKVDVSQHLDLFVELDTFYGLTQVGEAKISDSVAVSIGSEFQHGDEARLHPLFSDRLAFHFDVLDEDNLNKIYNWVLRRQEDKKKENEGLSFEIENVYSKRSHLPHNKIRQLIVEAKHIRSMGISNAYLAAQECEDSLKAFLQNGGLLEMLFLDPESENTIRRAQEEDLSKKSIIRKETIHAFEALLLIVGNYNNAHLYLYDNVPRFNAIFIDDLLILQFYSYNNKGKDNPVLCIRKNCEDSPLYNFIDATFEYLKNNATERREDYDD